MSAPGGLRVAAIEVSHWHGLHDSACRRPAPIGVQERARVAELIDRAYELAGRPSG